MATLHKNGMEEKKLSKYVTHRISDDHDVVTLSVSFPEEGQYGMDIYTRELRDGRTKIFVAVESFSYDYFLDIEMCCLPCIISAEKGNGKMKKKKNTQHLLRSST